MKVPVTIQAVAGSGLSSRLISWWGAGWHGYSHIDIVLPDGRLLGARSDTIGGAPRGGVFIRPPFYDKTWMRRSTVTCLVDQHLAKEAYKFALDQEGLPYAKDVIISLIEGKPDDPKGRWICSMLGGSFLFRAGAIADPGIPFSQMTPDTLHTCACAAGGTSRNYE